MMEVKRFDNPLGAEIRGIDLSREVGEQTFQGKFQQRTAARWALLCFRV